MILFFSLLRLSVHLKSWFKILCNSSRSAELPSLPSSKDPHYPLIDNTKGRNFFIIANLVRIAEFVLHWLRRLGSRKSGSCREHGIEKNTQHCIMRSRSY